MNLHTRLCGSNRPEHGLVQNVFGEWIDPSDASTAPPPGRVIEVTDELRARDAAERAAREAAPTQAWKIKRELSAANLKGGRMREMPRPKATSLRVAPVRAEVRVARVTRGKVAKPLRYCVQCQRELPRQGRRDVCNVCLPYSERRNMAARAKRAAAGRVTRYCKCGRRLSNYCKFDQCKPCRMEATKTQAVLEPESVPVAAQRAPHTRRPLCAHRGCATHLRAESIKRGDGLCGKHAVSKGSHARRVARVAVKCSGCGCVITLRTKTGLCLPCLRKQQARRTVLIAKSKQEYEADRLWARLSEADKFAVLGGAL